MHDSEIHFEENDTKGRFFVNGDGDDAEITFSKLGKTQIIADHTYVPDEFRGEGLAAKLLNSLLDYARENHLRIVPLCPYVAGQYKRHPEWSDLFSGK